MMIFGQDIVNYLLQKKQVIYYCYTHMYVITNTMHSTDMCTCVLYSKHG